MTRKPTEREKAEAQRKLEEAEAALRRRQALNAEKRRQQAITDRLEREREEREGQ